MRMATAMIIARAVPADISTIPYSGTGGRFSTVCVCGRWGEDMSIYAVWKETTGLADTLLTKILVLKRVNTL